MKVLYLHMIGAFGGASRSLYEAVRAFPDGAVEARFVTPRGSVTRFFSEIGEVAEASGLSQFDDTRYSYYRGLRWLVLAREIVRIPATIAAIREAHRRWGCVDLIHVNEFTGLLPWWLARRWFGVPVVVHVRSVARNAPRSLRSRLVNWMFLTKAEAVVAIDHTVRASLPHDLAVDIIHNAFSVAAAGGGAPPVRLRPASFKVGFVGNLLRVKGIHELVEAARITRDQGLDIEFIIVGDDARSSRGLLARLLKLTGIGQDARADVEAAIDAYGLRDRVHLTGFTTDIAGAYRSMDVLCFPSHYDAPGRPIFEAAFLGVPSIVAVNDPKPDTLIDGVTGIAVPPRDSSRLAAAIAALANNRALAQDMGWAAQTMAIENFDAKRNAAALLDVYRRCIAKRRPPANGDRDQ